MTRVELTLEKIKELEGAVASNKGRRNALVKILVCLTDNQRIQARCAQGKRMVKADRGHQRSKRTCSCLPPRKHRDDLIAAIELGISNERVEGINNEIMVTVKMACGVRNCDSLVVLATLRFGDYLPQLLAVR